ncbi:MAG TPA: biotin--[acetyl-CoA-carboxylase] ligase [Burkholderiales bacterium]|nr:biotin--[acetyl-CoA-carboxylase] ligase [Burkholderiales bacterium]
MERLDAGSIGLPDVEVRVVASCGSTNEVLLKQPGDATLLLAAEAQTAGRGRRGRRWHSTPGADLTFSLATTVQRPARELAALSLVAGVAAARALRNAGVRAVALKWPNDLVVGEAKLGGILVETRAAARGRTRVVFGIGINCLRTPGLEARLRRRVAFLDTFSSPDRNRLIRDIARNLLAALERFESSGFDAADWEAFDAHAGQRLRVRLADGRTLSGVACGLAEDGSLRLRSRKGVRAVRAGRLVTARAA